jgi:hypothetical protein
VNILVAQNFKGVNGQVSQKSKTGTGSMYSLHRLDVATRLLYPSRDDAQVMPLLAADAQGQRQDGAAAGGEPLATMTERLELPPAAITWADNNTPSTQQDMNGGAPATG